MPFGVLPIHKNVTSAFQPSRVALPSHSQKREKNAKAPAQCRPFPFLYPPIHKNSLPSPSVVATSHLKLCVHNRSRLLRTSEWTIVPETRSPFALHCSYYYLIILDLPLQHLWSYSLALDCAQTSCTTKRWDFYPETTVSDHLWCFLIVKCSGLVRV